MSASDEGRVLVSTHHLERAGELREAFKGAGYEVELVTPDEDVSGGAPIELLVVTGSPASVSAQTLVRSAHADSKAPAFAIVENADAIPGLAADYVEVFSDAAHADDVVFVARSLIERRRLQALAGIVGETDAIKEALERVVQFAPVGSTVLITGESGTGKELVARAIHRLSSRSDKAFVEVNCAAIPSELIESALFGHMKGSFTGAVADREGKFEQAHGGTLFLDEIGDMSLEAQAKVLRVLEQGVLTRVGGSKSIEVDVRVIAATNKDLEQQIEVGAFREDLFYRLNVVPIQIPALRERREDVPMLISHFCERMANGQGVVPKRFSSSAVERLQGLPWPGNVRELRNTVERLLILSTSPEVGPDDVDLLASGRSGSQSMADEILGLETFVEFKESAERAYIVQKLRENEWNVAETARRIEMPRSNLYKKIERYGLVRDG